MDASFFLDVMLNFRTAYIGSHILVTGQRAIAKHYLKVRVVCCACELDTSTLLRSCL